MIVGFMVFQHLLWFYGIVTAMQNGRNNYSHNKLSLRVCASGTCLATLFKRSLPMMNTNKCLKLLTLPNLRYKIYD